MENIITGLKQYLKETLGCSVQPVKWQNTGKMPFYMQDYYAFFQVRLFDRLCLLMVDQSREEQTPVTINKNRLRVQEIWADEVIYVRPLVSAYNRKRLIEHKVPFIIPGNQMYLPMLGIDLREYYKKVRGKAGLFSPSTQVVVLYELLRGIEHYYTPSRLAQVLGYTVMTLTRAFDELEGVGVGEVSMEGRERILRFKEKGRKLWDMSRDYLRSPVQKRVWVERLPEKRQTVQAGFTALDHYTMLSATKHPVYAVSQEDWKIMQQDRVKVLPIAEPYACVIEVWRYTPRRFEENKVVDRLSLYLSLRENTDERVEAALEEMIGGMNW